MTLHLKNDTGDVFKTSLWLTGGDAKGNNNFYVDKNGDEQYLPGFVIADHICLLGAGEDLGDLVEDTVTRGIKVYDFDAKKEVTKEFDVIEELDGQRVKLGIFKQVVDKTVLEGKVYVPTGETREQNEVNVVFSDEDDRTVMEMLAEEDEAGFMEEWNEAYKGKVFNKSKGAAKDGKSGAPSGDADSGDKKESKKKAGGIFGKKK